ncbi:hypothetical protein Cgig2_024277 [Carnegiea gigantea]|uniref:Uncharacterized protein n=1 Tax=Carnegiea gigantea TaxID=171969 RepID=A0A9Q1JVB9_9CARY|nr:hypothetical protein Cgig2_024277 [Carnegiea gigantea]
MISDSTTTIDPTRKASPSSPVADDLSFSTADTPTSVATRTPSITPQPSSATFPRPTPSIPRSIMHPSSLPFANLLTLVFKHIGACLDDKIKETKPITVITPASLKNIQFFKTATSAWKFVEDMTHKELVCVSKKYGQHVKPRLTSPQSTPPPSLLHHILTLDERVYELQETADKLEYIMVQHTDVLDGIAHN